MDELTEHIGDCTPDQTKKLRKVYMEAIAEDLSSELTDLLKQAVKEKDPDDRVTTLGDAVRFLKRMEKQPMKQTMPAASAQDEDAFCFLRSCKWLGRTKSNIWGGAVRNGISYFGRLLSSGSR